MCYESTQCTVVGQESSCTRYSHYKLYKIGLKTVQIKQEKEVLWIKAIFSSHIVIKYGNEGNLSSFILKISLEQDKMQICYNFVIPFSSLLLNEDIFYLPCFKYPNYLTDRLNIQMAVYYKSSSGSFEILILKQGVQIFLAKTAKC
ncbi:uncharacterized protein LOC118179670 isoform X2 [Stegodyphus dumicola]|uniref:uncharacterized protein LOC118179670 isoform X2 n=1 Tax=Stegodyphus dumicola TaxID=202533 RepID=UPI0015AEF536|nr:uncharacterized protein LOC118179670 isoform X2 [Stegodyphus dumicola]